jgi:hypothetical protein
MEERQAPILVAVMDLRARAASVEIAGPDELAATSADILFLAADRGLRPSMDVPLLTDLAMGLDEFKAGAKSLRPVGQKNGRRRLGRGSSATADQGEIPGQLTPDRQLASVLVVTSNYLAKGSGSGAPSEERS